jgi:hypothetical protein
MFKKITATLENLLDHDSNQNFVNELGLLDARKNYLASENLNELENLSYAHSFEVNDENLNILMDSLSCFFEMSFVFKKPLPIRATNLRRSSDFQADYVCLFGQKITSVHLQAPAKLPKTDLYKVLKTNAHSFLRKFKLQDLDSEKKMSCYLIRISENVTFVFVTNMADPWAKVKIETLQQTLMRINFNI